MTESIDTLYHYCSLDTFEKIISTKSIRLSSLELSNDYTEGRVIRSLIVSFLRKELLTQSQLTECMSLIDNFEKVVTGLGFCLSEDGDLLSQWRGYANDGQGIAIGFNKQYLERLSQKLDNDGPNPVKLDRISYVDKNGENPLEKDLRQLVAYFSEGAWNPTDICGPIAPTAKDISRSNYLDKISTTQLAKTISEKMFLLKMRAFSEEREWRIVTQPIKGQLSESIFKFRTTSSLMIPYREVSLEPIDNIQIINKIVVGPKNKTPDYIFDAFLRSKFKDWIKVIESEATYI